MPNTHTHAHKKKKIRMRSLPLAPLTQPPLCEALHSLCFCALAIRRSKNAVQIFLSLEDCLTMSSQATTRCSANILQHACNRRAFSKSSGDHHSGCGHICTPSKL